VREGRSFPEPPFGATQGDVRRGFFREKLEVHGVSGVVPLFSSARAISVVRDVRTVANSVEEKLAALTAIRAIETILLKQTWKKMAETAAKNQFSKEGAIIGLKALAKQLSINITKRKALAAIPYIGALIGGSMNAWYVRDIGWAARRLFQERWLMENGKIIDV
jgi:hypothetical protein